MSFISCADAEEQMASMDNIIVIFFILFYFFTFKIFALMATTTVLTVIKTAPAAGLNKIPCLYKTPAANDKATKL